MKSWVIQSKLEPSALSGTEIKREALISHFDDAVHKRVVILHAPAGFGKTSALTSWCLARRKSGPPIAWLSLDDKDKDPFHFLSYLVETFRVNGFVNGGELSANLGGLSELSLSEYTSSLITALGRTKRESVLILDDFHRAENEQNAEILNALIAQAPNNVHFILSTREYPGSLSLAELRARNELIEIDAETLRFRFEEIEQCLADLVSVEERDQSIDVLSDRTEGWPIAIATVRRWISEGAPIQETIEQISGRTSDLADYFVEQVFDALEGEVQQFLLKTSILERVSGELANHICGVEVGWEMLADLERRDLFVQRLDRERLWYRFHPLFAEFLQERLRRTDGNLVSDLHEAASTWFGAHGFESEAVHHALASERAEVIADLFERLGGWQYGLRGHIGSLERALFLLDDEALNRHPRVWTVKIYAALRTGDIAAASEHLGQLESLLEQGAESLDTALESEVRILSGAVAVYADDPVSEADIEALEQLGEAIDSGDELMHAVRCNLLCAMLSNKGRLEACMQFGNRAIRHFRAIDSLFGETFIYFHEGHANLLAGRIRDAQSLYEVGLELAVEHFGPTSDLAAIGSAFLAETAYETNDLHRANQLLKVALPHIERADAWTEVYIAAYTTGLKLSRTKFSLMSGAELRESALSTARQRRLPRLREVIEWQDAELFQWTDTDAAKHGQIEEVLTPTDSLFPGRVIKQRVRARERILSDDSESAVNILEKEREYCHESGFIRATVSLDLLLAVAYYQMDRVETSRGKFESALAVPLFEGIKRPFVDERRLIGELLKNFVKSSEGIRGNRLRDRFIAELLMEIGSDTKVHDEPDALSRREQEVLHLIVQGRSNREIAEVVGVSINTVKFHVKNLYEKLGVSDRKSAVNASIRRGLT